MVANLMIHAVTLSLRRRHRWGSQDLRYLALETRRPREPAGDGEVGIRAALVYGRV